MIQAFKRSPINLRRLFLVPKEHNPKGIALFLQGYCNLYRLAQKGNTQFGTPQEILTQIRSLADLLISLDSRKQLNSQLSRPVQAERNAELRSSIAEAQPGRCEATLNTKLSGACWGYNFDWQARTGLYFPKYTPTVVATHFAATALLDAATILNSSDADSLAQNSQKNKTSKRSNIGNPTSSELARMTWGEGSTRQDDLGEVAQKILKNRRPQDKDEEDSLDPRDLREINNLREVALSAAEFVINDLHRTPLGDGFLFSYSPLKGNDTVFNASLLGSRLLAYCAHETGNDTYQQAARASISACCSQQRDDGAWTYGMHPVQSWVDSFHTGYNLDALIAYQQLTGDTSFEDNIERGFNYYITHFFDPDGTPSYYDNKRYPIDIHCPAQLLITLSRSGRFNQYRDLAQKVLNWTIQHMQSPKGYFYYQLKQGINSRIPYMRWSNAFMFNALTYYLLSTNSV